MCASIIALGEGYDEKILIQDSTKLLGDLYLLNAWNFISRVIKLSLQLMCTTRAYIYISFLNVIFLQLIFFLFQQMQTKYYYAFLCFS